MILSTVTAVLMALAVPVASQACAGRTSGGSMGRQYGPYVSIGPTKNEIVRMETIYTPGKKPTGKKGLLFLWPGINDQSKSGGDLIQTVIESSPQSCGQDQWCLAP